MSFSTINSMGNFLPKKAVVAGGGVSVSGLWVAVGQGGLIANSTDGNTWTAAASTGGLSSFGSGVAYGKDGTGNGLWVAVGAGGLIAKSTDGNNWSPVASKGGLSIYGSKVAFNRILYDGVDF